MTHLHTLFQTMRPTSSLQVCQSPFCNLLLQCNTLHNASAVLHMHITLSGMLVLREHQVLSVCPALQSAGLRGCLQTRHRQAYKAVFLGILSRLREHLAEINMMHIPFHMSMCLSSRCCMDFLIQHLDMYHELLQETC